MFDRIRATLGGFGYVNFRRRVIVSTQNEQRNRRRPIDLETVIEIGDAAIKNIPVIILKTLFRFSIPKGLDCHLYNLRFPSPIIAAAFKDDLEILAFWRNFGLGGVTLKTLMPEPNSGNPRPRIQSISKSHGGGLINAMGLPGKGVKNAVTELRNANFLNTFTPTGFSLGGRSVDEYLTTFREFHNYLKNTRYAYFYEINISCPNTPEGQDMLKNPQLLSDLIQKIRLETQAVVSVKLSPSQSNDELVRFAKIVSEYPKTVLNLGNTKYKTCAEVGLAKNAISVGGGGYSGPGLFLRTLEMVRLLAPFGVPIIATGGISSPAQARLILKNGATLVGVATVLVENPFMIPKINRHLAVI